MGFTAVQLSLYTLAYVASVGAIRPYKLVDSYDHTNFFDKFHFFEVGDSRNRLYLGGSLTEIRLSRATSLLGTTMTSTQLVVMSITATERMPRNSAL